MKTKEQILIDSFAEFPVKDEHNLVLELSRIVATSTELQDIILGLELRLVNKCVRTGSRVPEAVIDDVCVLVNRLFHAGFVFGVMATDNIRTAQSTGECD